MLIALDPENKVDMHEVLEPLNLSTRPVPLANDQGFARRRSIRTATAPTW